MAYLSSPPYPVSYQRSPMVMAQLASCRLERAAVPTGGTRGWRAARSLCRISASSPQPRSLDLDARACFDLTCLAHSQLSRNHCLPLLTVTGDCSSTAPYWASPTRTPLPSPPTAPSAPPSSILLPPHAIAPTRSHSKPLRKRRNSSLEYCWPCKNIALSHWGQFGPTATLNIDTTRSSLRPTPRSHDIRRSLCHLFTQSPITSPYLICHESLPPVRHRLRGSAYHCTSYPESNISAPLSTSTHWLRTHDLCAAR